MRESGKLCEATICYTGDLTDPKETKYDLKYYVDLAKELEAAGAHILGIKDMGGLCKPGGRQAAGHHLKQEIGLPLHFHTHDTSGISAASVLAAAEAGVDAADAAMDAMSGLTSQPNLGSIAAALAGSRATPAWTARRLREINTYWEGCAGVSTPASRATCAPAPPRSTSTACRAASSPTCRNRPAPSAWRASGPTVEKAYAQVNTCSATSSR